MRLLLTAHHTVVDGWSTPILVRELLEIYAAGGSAAALPAVRPYRDYLAWLDGRTTMRRANSGGKRWTASTDRRSSPRRFTRDAQGAPP